MEIGRRGFLKGMAAILASGIAPSIITTPGLLMPGRGIIVPPMADAWDYGFVYKPSASDPLAQRPYVRKNGILIPAEEEHFRLFGVIE